MYNGSGNFQLFTTVHGWSNVSYRGSHSLSLSASYNQSVEDKVLSSQKDQVIWLPSHYLSLTLEGERVLYLTYEMRGL